MTKSRKTYTFSRVIGTPKYMKFDNDLIIYRPEKDPILGVDAVYVKEWGRWVACADYDNHFVALNPYFANPEYPGMNTVWAFCSCGSQAVVVGYKQYKDGASPSSGGGIIPGEMLVCKEFTDNLSEHGHGKHRDGSS